MRIRDYSAGVVCRLIETTSLEERAINRDKRTMDFVLSTPGRKGDGLKLDPKGWDLARFEKNPVMLDHHMSLRWLFDPNTRFPVGKWSGVRVHGTTGVMRGTAHFAEADVNPAAETLWQLYSNDFMRAISIGFGVKRGAWEDPEDRKKGYNSFEQELYEASAVTLPMDADAVADGRDIESLRLSLERSLDAQPETRAWMETLWRVFRTPVTYSVPPVPARSEFANFATPEPFVPAGTGQADPTGRPRTQGTPLEAYCLQTNRRLIDREVLERLVNASGATITHDDGVVVTCQDQRNPDDELVVIRFKEGES